MSRVRPLLSVVMAAVLLAAAAGPEAYAAASRVVETKTGAVVPAQNVKAAVVPTVAVPVLPANPIAVKAAAPVASGAAAANGAQAQGPATTLDRLSVPLPDFQAQGDDSKDAAGADFLKRTAEGDEAAAASAVGVSASVTAASGAKTTLAPSRRRTPGPDDVDDGTDDRRRSPDDPLNSDDLGNVPRDPGRDDGPDGTGGGGPMVRVPKTHRGLSGTALSLALVAGGALAFAAFGALGFTALAAGSSIVAALNAIPLVSDIAFHGAHASAALPLVASMALAPVVGMGGPVQLPPAAPQNGKPVEFVVKLTGAAQPLSEFLHLSFADPRTRRGFAQYRQIADRLYAQLQAAGIGRGDLDQLGVAPVATYDKINTATFLVDPARAAEVRTWLESQGHTVYQDVQRSIVRPMPRPTDAAILRNAVKMEENLEISRAASVHKIARQMYGDPDAGLVTRLALRLVGAAIPQVKHAVIDTGISSKLAWLKGVVEKNVTSKAPGDDDGHGSWTQGTEILFAPWLRKTATHYKAFVGGNASLDDILKALTMAANDGNLVISNSWGDDEGDPYSPDSQLVRKLAEEGHIMVFAAGNAGPGKNTVGNPGGVVYKDSKTGALRVLSIPAAKRDKSVDYFSSRGPRPRKVKDDANYPHVPTGPTAIGSNVEGPYPQEFGVDRVDPVYGPVKAEWGTSMATPAVAGAIVLLCMLFGVTTRGEKLDAIVNALMATVEKTSDGPDAAGEGFINVEAAYAALKATMTPVVPNFAAKLVIRLLAPREGAMPRSIASERAAILRELASYDLRSRDFRSYRRTYNDDVDPMFDEQEAILRRRLEQIDEQYKPKGN